MKASTKRAFERIKARTAQIVVGRTYFLSSFYSKSGAIVKVLSKSTNLNRAGWPSSVEVEVIEPINEREFYAVGTKHTVNATNLYEKREQAGHSVKRGIVAFEDAAIV